MTKPRTLSQHVATAGELLGAVARHAGQASRAWQKKALDPGGIHRPWMLPREIWIVEDLLLRKRPLSCLEWGSGGSTVWFPGLISDDSRWLAIEHDRGWADRVKATKLKQYVSVVYVPPVEARFASPADAERPEARFQDYVQRPAREGSFDFVLVDGRARSSCLNLSREILSPDGVVVLHDANRPRYHAALEAFPQGVRFSDSRHDGGGLWIGSLDRELGDLMDLDRHRRVWEFFGGRVHVGPGAGRPLSSGAVSE
jgi:hypothetical protein